MAYTLLYKNCNPTTHDIGTGIKRISCMTPNDKCLKKNNQGTLDMNCFSDL